MTIEEAVIDLGIQREAKSRFGRLYEANAIRLGIEALKRIQSQRSPHPNDTYQPLPGEDD